MSKQKKNYKGKKPKNKQFIKETFKFDLTKPPKKETNKDRSIARGYEKLYRGI